MHKNRGLEGGDSKLAYIEQYFSYFNLFSVVLFLTAFSFLRDFSRADQPFSS